MNFFLLNAADDWKQLFVDRENNAQARPSVIKVRRLLNLISKLKNLVPNGIIGKSVVLLSDNEDSRGEAPFFSDGDPSDEDEISGDSSFFSVFFQYF